MAIQESKKQTDIEKRLKLLRQQMYGKDRPQPVISYQTKEVDHIKASALKAKTQTSIHSSEIGFLYQDLFKIGIFATLALGIQLILFYLVQNHIVRLNLF